MSAANTRVHTRITSDQKKKKKKKRFMLPPGLSVTYGPPVAPPDDFDHGYTLPVHETKPLQDLRAAHPLDARLKFYETPHVYELDGVPLLTSGTGVAHEFEQPFDGPSVIAKMRSSPREAWPREEYVHDKRTDGFEADRGMILVAGGKTVSVIQPGGLCPRTALDRHAALSLLKATCIKNAPDPLCDAEVYSFSREMTTDEILDKWGQNGRIASHKGTHAHWLAECYANGLPHEWWAPEMVVVRKFVEEHLAPRGMYAYATEMEIVYERGRIGGSIDLILHEPSTGLYHIVDYKRTPKMPAQMRGFSRMKEPMQHLDDCKVAGYALQVSLYKAILERDYDMRIGDLILLSIHPDAPFCTSVPYLEAEVDYLLARREAIALAQEAVARSDSAFRCSITDAPLFEAVFIDEPGAHRGKRAMQRAASVRGMSYTVDEETAASFDASGRVVEFPTPTFTKTWRSLVPPRASPFSSSVTTS